MLYSLFSQFVSYRTTYRHSVHMTPGVACSMQTFLLHTAHSCFTFRSALRGQMWQRRFLGGSLLLWLPSTAVCTPCMLARLIELLTSPCRALGFAERTAFCSCPTAT